tara:strand:+ start:70 stop:483 length:414 start_codon:yes stop_codon:yes gene_type:complete
MLNYFYHKSNLSAVLIRSSRLPKNNTFHTKNSDTMQLGELYFKKGSLVEPHMHLLRKRTVFRTTETLIIKKGNCDIFLYDKKTKIKKFNLKSGDIILLNNIAHSIEFKSNTHIVEIKQGPYSIKGDKIKFREISNEK